MAPRKAMLRLSLLQGLQHLSLEYDYRLRTPGWRRSDAQRGQVRLLERHSKDCVQMLSVSSHTVVSAAHSGLALAKHSASIRRQRHDCAQHSLGGCAMSPGESSSHLLQTLMVNIALTVSRDGMKVTCRCCCASQILAFANATMGMMPPPDSWGPQHCMAAEAPHTQWLRPAAAAAADMAAAQAKGGEACARGWHEPCR